MYNFRFVRRIFLDDFIYLYLFSDFGELMKSLLNNGKSIISLIFNIQMINEQNRFKKFCQMLSNCSNLINLR
jgi:hypothetical protein